MRRSQVRFVLAMTVTLLFVTVGYHLVVSFQRQNEQPFPDLPPPPPGADQRMQDFRHAKMQDGKKVWEVAARQARFSQETGELIIDEPELSLFLDNGEMVALRCREGRIYMDGEQDITRMQLRGDIKMQIGNFFLHTQEAMYESERNIVSASSPVSITGRGFTAEGQSYTVEVADKRVTLNAGVTTTVTEENAGGNG